MGTDDPRYKFPTTRTIDRTMWGFDFGPMFVINLDRK